MGHKMMTREEMLAIAEYEEGKEKKEPVEAFEGGRNIHGESRTKKTDTGHSYSKPWGSYTCG